MKQKMSSEFLFQVFALLITVIVVHAVYVGVVRPIARAHIEHEAALQASKVEYVPTRSFAVVIGDYEQEAEVILTIWVLAFMGYKARRVMHERDMLERRLLDIPEGTSVLPQDAREYSRALEALPEAEQDYLLPRTLLSALQRFASTGNIQAVSDTIKENCEIESERMDSEMSMARYVTWAIPSIGFIGTVRGIGDALGQAYKAMEGDISGVTVSLGVAFNSTFVALMLSMVIMFCLHQLQLSQERLVMDCQRYADRRLLRFLVAPQ
jgi:biopolymer transport protein ExbB/TolQ